MADGSAKNDSGGGLVVFGSKQIRRVWYEDQWYFSVVDIVGVLTDSPNARDYWYRMKQREEESSGFQLSTLCRQLKLTSADGKSYKADCVNVKSVFRVIQSIPSPSSCSSSANACPRWPGRAVAASLRRFPTIALPRPHAVRW